MLDSSFGRAMSFTPLYAGETLFQESQQQSTRFTPLYAGETRIIAEQNAAVFKATNDQMQTRIDDQTVQINELKATVTGLKEELKEEVKDSHEYVSRLEEVIENFKRTQATELAAQTKATHAAEKRAVSAEATVTASATQIIDLQKNIEQLRTLSATIPIVE